MKNKPILFNVLTIDNQNAIDNRAKTKVNGVYTFRGIIYRVVDGQVTHYGSSGKILGRFGNFTTCVGEYDTREQGTKKLKLL